MLILENVSSQLEFVTVQLKSYKQKLLRGIFSDHYERRSVGSVLHCPAALHLSMTSLCLNRAQHHLPLAI